MKTINHNHKLFSVCRLRPVFLYFSLFTFHFSLFTFYLTPYTFGQNLKRLELPVPNNAELFHTIPLGPKGVLLVSQIAKNSFNLAKFSADLERDWSVNGNVEDNLEFVRSSFDGESVYLLFSRARTDFYQVVKVSVGPGFVETFFLSAVERFQITDFQTVNYSVFMAGTVRDEPLLLYTNLATKKSKILPGVTQANTVIQSVELDTTHQVMNVIYAARKGREVKLIAKTFDQDGQPVGQVLVEPEPDYSLLNGRLFMMNDSTKLLIGTYGFRNMQASGNSSSQGLFLSKVVYDQVEFTQYHSFTNFQNFFNFMSERERERMQRRIERKKEDGSDVKLNYRVLVHDIIPQNGNYLVSGEVFYPEYRNNNMGMGPWGMNSFWGGGMGGFNNFGFSPFGLYNPYFFNPFFGGNRFNNNGQVFNGFVYTHAIVAGFTPKGELIWDNSLPFDNVRSMELKEKMKVKLNADNTVAMFYSNKGAIKAQVFDQNKVVANLNPIAIATEESGEKIRQTSTDEVVFWYDNYYLAYGYQKIAGSEGRRNVFYLNKIAF